MTSRHEQIHLFSKNALYSGCIIAPYFFLPDIVGPVPALLIGLLTIGCALFVYNKWDSHAANDQVGKFETKDNRKEDT